MKDYKKLRNILRNNFPKNIRFKRPVQGLHPYLRRILANWK